MFNDSPFVRLIHQYFTSVRYQHWKKNDEIWIANIEEEKKMAPRTLLAFFSFVKRLKLFSTFFILFYFIKKGYSRALSAFFSFVLNYSNHLKLTSIFIYFIIFFPSEKVLNFHIYLINNLILIHVFHFCNCLSNSDKNWCKVNFLMILYGDKL